MRSIPRRSVFLALYLGTTVFWFGLFEPEFGEIELVDLGVFGLSLLFAGLIALVVFTFELPVLEVGWGIFTYAQLFRLLDTVGEGPEIFEAVVPGTLQLLGLGFLLVGFTRATSRLQSKVSQRNERLRVLNRLLRHNLRNGLSPIISSLRHFRDEATTEQETQFATVALNNAWELSDQSDKVRTIDRVLDTAEDTDPQQFDLVSVVDWAVSEFRDTYPGVTFEITAPESVTVSAIPGLEVALENVLENACEHNDATDPVVEITVETDGSDGVVRITDNGSGIPPEELKSLRERNESDLLHGSGIGLWIVSWIVEKSDGQLQFEDSDGQTVTIRLPRADTGRYRSVVDTLNRVW